MPPEVVAALRSDARDNRDRILAAARAEGPGAPIRAIARRAGVGVATVHRHFRTKDALLAEAGWATPCSDIVAEGLAVADPWRGFALVVEKLMAHRPVAVLDAAAERERSLRRLQELVRRAKDAGALRPDFVLEDLSLAVMAADGIRAATPARQNAAARQNTAARQDAAARRFAALLLQSYQAEPVRTPLPPAVRILLYR